MPMNLAWKPYRQPGSIHSKATALRDAYGITAYCKASNATLTKQVDWTIRRHCNALLILPSRVFDPREKFPDGHS